MPPLHVAPYVPLVIAPLFTGLSLWSGWRLRAIYRKRGRRQVDEMLARRGETLVAIETLPYSALQVRTGLSSTLIYQIRARRADGQEQTYEWAYEPRVFPWQTEGLKRCAHGVWIAVA